MWFKCCVLNVIVFEKRKCDNNFSFAFSIITLFFVCFIRYLFLRLPADTRNYLMMPKLSKARLGAKPLTQVHNNSIHIMQKHTAAQLVFIHQDKQAEPENKTIKTVTVADTQMNNKKELKLLLGLIGEPIQLCFLNFLSNVYLFLFAVVIDFMFWNTRVGRKLKNIFVDVLSFVIRPLSYIITSIFESNNFASEKR